MAQTPEGLRAKAAEADRKAEESFERSDTDGFLSQWALNITARKDRLQAELLENGGRSEFLALFDADGEQVPARQIDTRYGTKWGVFASWADAEAYGGDIIQWVNVAYTDRQRANLAKKGFRQGWVLKRAVAKILGSGTGLSGAANAFVGVVPVDRDERGEFVRWMEGDE
jgi:hypothetical protein